jgi:hypothetical protein
VLTFERGPKYTRPDVKERAGLPRDAKGGNWDTGIVEHENEFIVFTNVGTQGANGAHLWESVGRQLPSLVPQGGLSSRLA